MNVEFYKTYSYAWFIALELILNPQISCIA